MNLNISTTNNAKNFIINNKTNNELYFTIIIKGGGCAGLSYDYSYKTENELRELNMVNISDDDSFDIWTNKASMIYLAGCELRYEEGLNSKGLEVYNPQASRTCACGVSFSV